MNGTIIALVEAYQAALIVGEKVAIEKARAALAEHVGDEIARTIRIGFMCRAHVLDE